MDNNSIPYILPIDKNVKRYLSLIIDGRLEEGKSYIPILQREEFTEGDTSKIYNLVSDKCNTNDKDTFMYFISELTTNIVEHSLCSNSLFMAQQYPKKRFTELAFFDNGITIPGSLRETGKWKDISDQQLIVNAVYGLSSKPESDRGRGLGSSINVITKLLKGEIFIASGEGTFYTNKEVGDNKYSSYTLNKEHRLNGTLISIRLPFPAPKKSNIYKPGIL